MIINWRSDDRSWPKTGVRGEILIIVVMSHTEILYDKIEEKIANVFHQLCRESLRTPCNIQICIVHPEGQVNNFNMT